MISQRLYTAFATLLLTIQGVRGISTQCDPTAKDCPDVIGLNKAKDYIDFTKGASKDGLWLSSGKGITYGANGAELTVLTAQDTPILQSSYYILEGSISVVMKSALGTGVISAFILGSDDLDEIDYSTYGSWQNLAFTDYSGRNTAPNGENRVNVTDANHQQMFHNYSISWTKEYINWYLDGDLRRSATRLDTISRGRKWPQTPMTIRLGLLVDTWTPWEQPLSVPQGGSIMTIKEVTVINGRPAAGYRYTDVSGLEENISLLSTTPNPSVTVTKSATGTPTTGTTNTGSSSMNVYGPTNTGSSSMNVYGPTNTGSSSMNPYGAGSSTANPYGAGSSTANPYGAGSSTADPYAAGSSSMNGYAASSDDNGYPGTTSDATPYEQPTPTPSKHQKHRRPDQYNNGNTRPGDYNQDQNTNTASTSQEYENTSKVDRYATPDSSTPVSPKTASAIIYTTPPVVTVTVIKSKLCTATPTPSTPSVYAKPPSSSPTLTASTTLQTVYAQTSPTTTQNNGGIYAATTAAGTSASRVGSLPWQSDSYDTAAAATPRPPTKRRRWFAYNA